MRVALSGWPGKVAKWTVEVLVMAAFMVSGIAAGVAPYSAVVSVVTILALVTGFYLILSQEQIERSPKHVRSTAVMLTASHVFFVALIEAPKSLVSLEGAIAGLSIATIIGVGLYKDYILDDVEFDGEPFTVEIGGGSR